MGRNFVSLRKFLFGRYFVLLFFQIFILMSAFYLDNMTGINLFLFIIYWTQQDDDSNEKKTKNENKQKNKTTKNKHELEILSIARDKVTEKETT